MIVDMVNYVMQTTVPIACDIQAAIDSAQSLEIDGAQDVEVEVELEKVFEDDFTSWRWYVSVLVVVGKAYLVNLRNDIESHMNRAFEKVYTSPPPEDREWSISELDAMYALLDSISGEDDTGKIQKNFFWFKKGTPIKEVEDWIESQYSD